MATSKNIERARRGAAWLDRKLGRGWRRKIRRRQLDMARGYMGSPRDCGCILAQLDLSQGYGEGRFSRFADSIGLHALVANGFVAAEPVGKKDRYGEQLKAQYEDLTEAWREVLREAV